MTFIKSKNIFLRRFNNEEPTESGMVVQDVVTHDSRFTKNPRTTMSRVSSAISILMSYAQSRIVAQGNLFDCLPFTIQKVLVIYSPLIAETE